MTGDFCWFRNFKFTNVPATKSKWDISSTLAWRSTGKEVTIFFFKNLSKPACGPFPKVISGNQTFEWPTNFKFTNIPATKSKWDISSTLAWRSTGKEVTIFFFKNLSKPACGPFPKVISGNQTFEWPTNFKFTNIPATKSKWDISSTLARRGRGKGVTKFFFQNLSKPACGSFPNIISAN